jgi:hypothetical protein
VRFSGGQAEHYCRSSIRGNQMNFGVPSAARFPDSLRSVFLKPQSGRIHAQEIQVDRSGVGAVVGVGYPAEVRMSAWRKTLTCARGLRFWDTDPWPSITTIRIRNVSVTVARHYGIAKSDKVGMIAALVIALGRSLARQNPTFLLPSQRIDYRHKSPQVIQTWISCKVRTKRKDRAVGIGPKWTQICFGWVCINH